MTNRIITNKIRFLIVIQKTLERLTVDLDWINGEAQRYGLELKEDVLAAFPDAADQEVMKTSLATDGLC